MVHGDFKPGEVCKTSGEYRCVTCQRFGRESTIRLEAGRRSPSALRARSGERSRSIRSGSRRPARRDEPARRPCQIGSNSRLAGRLDQHSSQDKHRPAPRLGRAPARSSVIAAGATGPRLRRSWRSPRASCRTAVRRSSPGSPPPVARRLRAAIMTGVTARAGSLRDQPEIEVLVLPGSRSATPETAWSTVSESTANS